ncbi:MAG: Asp-tRNA(Asn)/Glu-tRNA(Gln) amidotransferase subunit GatB [archaeon]|nr:Asp-tRNA(Asn)/Glu-tRNA(Gln) amidotransferase subunit GatB [archaeon]
MDDYPMMCGLETHVQLPSKTKIFCGCENPINTKKETGPNTLTCPTCLGMPGSKPRTNRKVIRLATKAALALNCKIAKDMFFSRKTYFYPDMSKNFQTTQFEIPLATLGTIEIDIEGKKKKIRIRRVHIEEDPAKLVHENNNTLVDYNRAGVPLIEIVTEPDFTSPKEARIYLFKLAQILEYLCIYDPDSSASIKTDANISIMGGERAEVKNITGTKEIERALSFEYIRQKNMYKRGSKITQETRRWLPESGITKLMRTKETEADYGYIFEPDLTEITIKESEKSEIKKQLPELPDEKKARFTKQYRISQKAAEGITSEPRLADLFENVAKKVKTEVASAWLAGPLLKTLNYNNRTYKTSGLKEKWIIDLLLDFQKGKYSDLTTEKILWKMLDDKTDHITAAKKHGFSAIDATLDIKKIIGKIIKSNQKAAADYKSGEQKALNFLVGQVMKETRGAIDAKSAREEILKFI